MYQVYANGAILFETGIDELQLFGTPLELEIGKTGSFQFTIYPNHPGFDNVVHMAMVRVSRRYNTIYTGRILDIEYGIYGEKKVFCEGELAYLLDSMIPPHTYTGSFSGYFKYVLETHNTLVDSDKQFLPGVVTVGEFYPFTVTQKAEYKSAFDVLNAQMVQPSGGYLQVRYENGYRYLDLLSYTADVSNISGQEIRLGENLLDISRKIQGAAMFSGIVPLGAKLEGSEERLDIKSVNSGDPYIVNETAVAACRGRIFRQVIFENITNAKTLKDTAENYLAENYAGEYSIEITAADLSGQDATIDHFRVGQWVRVYNEIHFGYSPQLFLIQKLSINLLNPAANKIVIGKVKRGLTDEMASLSNSVESISVPEAVQPYVMDSGTTGIWTWKKFSDNTCEFFGKVPVTSYNVNTALGGWYRGANLYEATAYDYPVTMTEAPALEMTFQTRNGQAALLWIYSPDAATAQSYLPQAFLIRPTTATGIHGNINIIAKGKIQS